MRSHRDEVDLSAELRALRPTPRPEFTAELDARADAGFPQASRPPSSNTGRMSERLRALGHVPALLRAAPRRRVLVPAGAAAAAAIAVATALVLTSEGEPTSDIAQTLSHSSTQSNDSSGVQFSEAPPVKGKSDAAAGRAEGTPSAAGALPAPGPYASGIAHRDIERSAEIVLGTDPSGVRGAAAKVFETVHAYHGIVLRSSISDGREGQAGATFELLVPSGRLGDAMAAFSAIADVRSRHESSLDVTAPTIGLRERLRDARAKVAGFLAAVSEAETEAERETAEAKLRSARRHVARLQARLATLQRRTHLSSVSLRIESGGTASDGGGWGIGDALGDAGRILGVAAGVSLVGLAILAPPILIVLLAWLARRAWLRRRRERALD
jgi:hypothetical protein